MWKQDTGKMSRIRNEMRTYEPKGDESRVPIDMWDSRTLKDQGVVVSEALNNIWEGILRWWRYKLMRELCRVLRWILSSWRSVGTS